MDNPEKLSTQGTQDEEKQNKNNPEKLSTQGTQDEEKQNKNTAQYVPDTTTRRYFTNSKICFILLGMHVNMYMYK